MLKYVKFNNNLALISLQYTKCTANMRIKQKTKMLTKLLCIIHIYTFIADTLYKPNI